MNDCCFTNGCFDILHEGHLKLLKKCKELSKYNVLVAINSDNSVKRLKGESRPINNETARINNLLNTKLVSKVIVFEDEEGLEKLISEIKPKYLVKGNEYKKEDIVGYDIVEKNGGEIVLIDMLPNLSTSNLIKLKNESILVTGGMGFIGSNVIRCLNKLGITNITIVDVFDKSEKWKNLIDLQFNDLMSYDDFIKHIDSDTEYKKILYHKFIIHLGAISNTREADFNDLYTYNTKFTNSLIARVRSNILNQKIIYASSAATYGSDESSFVERVDNIKPLNAYGYSKLLSDKFLIDSKGFAGFKGYGLRFFNVYGPGENHKNNMISAISKFINYDKETEVHWKHPFHLFKSYKEGIAHGLQKRDFIHVNDVCKVILHFVLNDIPTDIYNVGSGMSTSFIQVCNEINQNRSIEYIDMPDDLKPIYQYYTCADLTKLRTVANYTEPFLTVKEGVNLYDNV